MGRGNFTARGNNEGQYYVPNELFEYYWKPGEQGEDEDMSRSCAELWKQGVNLDEDGWEYDEARTSMEWQDILNNFMEDFAKKFPSFQRVNDSWVESHGAEGRAILENNLFYIAIADNETSMAVVLMEKEDAPECFQARHCDSYLEGIKECLLNNVSYINFRTSAWTQGTITREEFQAHKVKQTN